MYKSTSAAHFSLFYFEHLVQSCGVILMKKLKMLLRPALIAAVVLLCALAATYLTTPHEKTVGAEHISDAKKQIALTFDDGPGDDTMRLLDGLRERGVKASFFLMGRKVEKRPEAVAQMYADGHLIGNHSFSHISFFANAEDEIAAELARTDDAIEAVTGERTRFYRPPYGYYFGWQLNAIDKIAVLWSDTPRDWVNTDEDYIYDYLVSHARDGEVILLHDTKPGTVSAALRAIDTLSAQGYEFVRADELLCRSGALLAPGLGYRMCLDGAPPFYF